VNFEVSPARKGGQVSGVVPEAPEKSDHIPVVHKACWTYLCVYSRCRNVPPLVSKSRIFDVRNLHALIRKKESLADVGRMFGLLPTDIRHLKSQRSSVALCKLLNY